MTKEEYEAKLNNEEIKGDLKNSTDALDRAIELLTVMNNKIKIEYNEYVTGDSDPDFYKSRYDSLVELDDNLDDSIKEIRDLFRL